MAIVDLPPSPLFPGFRRLDVRAGDATIRCVLAGSGPPLLLLHGYPQTHAIWRQVAPRLADRYTVVASDLRGYGESSKPPSAPDHAPYSKRAMAADQVALMRALGHERFHLVGHDRGGRVAHRLALDHADAVATWVTLDIAPTLHMYERTTMGFATAYYHWFLLIQEAPVPERLIGADPVGFLDQHLGRRHAGLATFHPDALAEYRRRFADPAAIHASCEDYRAAATIDLDHDRADLDRKVEAPLLALWGREGAIERFFDCLPAWRERVRDVRGRSLPCGHYIPEERPDDVVEAVIEHCR